MSLPVGVLVYVVPSAVAWLALALVALVLGRRGRPIARSTAIVGAAFGAIWGAVWAVWPGEANYVLNVVPALMGSEAYRLVSALSQPLATDDSIDPTPWLFRLPQIEMLASIAFWALAGAAAGHVAGRTRARGASRPRDAG